MAGAEPVVGSGVTLTVTDARRRREWRTVRAMVRLFCAHRHGSGAGPLCADCAGLLAYAQMRLARCPFGRHKPTCARCPIHCYRPTERATMREVMRWAGPRLLGVRTVLALLHGFDALRPVPKKR